MARRRDRLLLLAGDGFSAFGGWVDFLAILTLAAWQFHVTPLQMALVSAAGLLPGIVAAPWIGRWCDRGEPCRLLQVSIAGRAAATAAILASPAGFGLAAFVGCVALRSLFASVAPPAIHVLVVRSVEAAERPRTFAALNVINNAAKVLAPALGTLTSSLAGEPVALALSLVCSLAAFATFAALPKPAAAAAAAARSPGDAAAVLPSTVPLLWLASTVAFCVFAVNNLVPLVLQRAGLDKALLGVLVGCSGAGNIVSGLWLARRPAALRGALAEIVRPALAQTVGFGLIGVALALHAGAWALPPLFFAIGTVSARYAIALNVHLTTHFAADIGRVSATLQGWQNTMILVAPLLGALVLERFGSAALFVFATGGALLSLALLTRWPSHDIRILDDKSSKLEA